MNGNISAVTPLQVYQKAFDLHYKGRKIAQACDMYEQIVRQFPESEVSAYASIQLQKIHASEITRSLARRSTISLAMTMLLLANLIATIALAVIMTIHIASAQPFRAQQRLIDRALARMYAGRDDDALDILKTAKMMNPREISPFAIAAEIFRKNHEYLKARKEFDTFRRLNPGDALAELEIESIDEEEDLHIGKAMESKEAEKEIPEDVVKNEDLKAKQRLDARQKRTPRTPQSSKRKPKLLVPVDSITFF